ncbi:hypothetical protein INR49_024610, partial [Caranx melampygus]
PAGAAPALHRSSDRRVYPVTKKEVEPKQTVEQSRGRMPFHFCPITTRPALRKTRKSLISEDATPPVVPSTNLVRDDRQDIGIQTSRPKPTVTFKLNPEVEPTIEISASPVVKSPRLVRGKAKLSSPATSGKAEESTVDGSAKAVQSPVSSPISRSPLKGKNKAKKAKHAPAVEPLQEGEEVMDTTGKKWKLMKLLSQSTADIIYEVSQTVSRSISKESNHILKLGAKDGRIFNEQNFLQRAAKPASAPSRRSDLQSLGYCMLRWHTGMLPWTALTLPEQVASQKQRFMEDVPALMTHCFGKTQVSSAFQSYLTAVMALQYTEQPDYSALKAGLSAALMKMGGSLEQPLSF